MEPPVSIPVLSDDGLILVGPDEVKVSDFFVPTRILWPEFSEFIEGKNDEQD